MLSFKVASKKTDKVCKKMKLRGKTSETSLNPSCKFTDECKRRVLACALVTLFVSLMIKPTDMQPRL